MYFIRIHLIVISGRFTNMLPFLISADHTDTLVMGARAIH